MISLNSSTESTIVVNSRAHKKRPVVWRRRKGMDSKIVFTTYERASLADNKPVLLQTGKENFNLGKLLISIAKSLGHHPRSAEYDSLWLAQTVEDRLSLDDRPLTPQLIAEETYVILKRFDAIAGIHYGATHGIISNVRRRGRPSLNG